MSKPLRSSGLQCNYLITGDSSEILDEDSAGSVTTSRLGVL